MKNNTKTQQMINNYNDCKEKIYEIENFYNKKLHEMMCIANSIRKKSFGKNNRIYYYNNIHTEELEWLNYTEAIRPAYRFGIQSINNDYIEIILRKRTLSRSRNEDFIQDIPQSLLKLSNREFAKLVRQQIKKHKIQKQQNTLQNFDEILKHKTKSLNALESEINHMYKMKKKSGQAS